MGVEIMINIPTLDYSNCKNMQPFLVAHGLPGGNSKWEPPESISNSEVKTLSADDSVAFAM